MRGSNGMHWLRKGLASGRQLLPKKLRRGIVKATRWPRVGSVDFGTLRRLTPISRSWGGDRGTPIDRYYIEGFLESCRDDIRGRVLEIGNNVYTLRFGGGRVEVSEILDAATDNPQATYVDDLTRGSTIPSAHFDCVICTQTLHLIPDIQQAVGTLHRILKPGGVLLATFPGISPIYRDEHDRWGDFWRLTDRAVRWLACRVFADAQVRVEIRGNVFSAISFLHGMSAEELEKEELDSIDRDYQVVVVARAVRGTGA